MSANVYDANVRIKDLPRAADRIVSTLASLRGVNKWEVVRDAIVEYAENHAHEITVEKARG